MNLYCGYVLEITRKTEQKLNYTGRKETTKISIKWTSKFDTQNLTLKDKLNSLLAIRYNGLKL